LPRKTDSGNPSDWLHVAESELVGIRLLVEQEVSYWMCQSKLAEILEKVLKAELIRSGWRLIKTHDLQRLAGELHALSSDLTETIKPLCASLAEKYFIDRYPGFDLDDPDWKVLRGQLDQVAALLAKVKSRIQ
jgi:HEPN domain-containing protein